MNTSPEDMSAFWTDAREEKTSTGGRPVYDVAALLARCGVGVVFLAHGWQKIQVGVTATGHAFDAMGVPAPTAAAVYATFVELLAGAALILGIALPVAGTLLFLDMAGAFVFVHARHGILLVDKGTVRNGFELVLVLGLASLVFAAGGAGRLTLDHRLFGRRKRHGRPGHRRTPRPDPTPAIPAVKETLPAPGGADAPGAPPRPAAGGPLPPEGGAPASATGGGSFAAPPESGRPASATGGSSSPRPRRTATRGTSRDVPVAGHKPEQEPTAEKPPSARRRKGSSAKDS